MKHLLEVFLVFSRLGCLSLGAALSVLPEMSRQLITVHHWLTVREFTDGYSLGQLAPGPNMLAVFFFGYYIAGVPGALAAGLGMFGPPLTITLIIAAVWRNIKDHPWAMALQRTLLPVGAGLMASGVLTLTRNALRPWELVGISILAAVIIQKWKINPAIIVLCGGVLGALFFRP